MNEKIIEFFMTQGPWAVLFVSFYFYDQKRQDKREKRWEEREANYQTIINQLTEKFNLIGKIEEGLQGIKDDVKEVKAWVFKNDR